MLLFRRKFTPHTAFVHHDFAHGAYTVTEKKNRRKFYEELENEREEEKKELEKEKKLQQAILAIQKKHGMNALLKGMNLEEGATTRDRNGQIGGHKA